ncbi:MAG: hypothetical protein JRH20_31215, partial [Deltaproteobacteria bacterium]|nr:hypothetical protein [Deltaproteobacteria bacterium]
MRSCVLPLVLVALTLPLTAHAGKGHTRHRKAHSKAHHKAHRKSLLHNIQRLVKRSAKQVRKVVHHKSKAISRTKLAKSGLGQFAVGLFIDGPRESWRAMRSHRKVFIGGLLGVGVLAVWGASL